MTKKKLLVGVALVLAGVVSTGAMADNPLTENQLLKITESALRDYAANEPEMTRSVSGFRTVTQGKNAKVLIYMQADGMNMTATYFCVPDGDKYGCHAKE